VRGHIAVGGESADEMAVALWRKLNLIFPYGAPGRLRSAWEFLPAL